MKSNLYVSTDTTMLPAQSAWVNTYAYCADQFDILLNGWCTGPGAGGINFGGEGGVNLTNSGVAGWACLHQNPTNTPTPVSSHVVCISVP